MKLTLKKEPKKVHFFLKGLELLCIIGQNLYKSDSGSKRACKKAEGLSSWMMDAVESATGTGSVLVHPVQWPKATELVHSRMCSKKLTLTSWTGLLGHHSGSRLCDGQRRAAQ